MNTNPGAATHATEHAGYFRISRWNAWAPGVGTPADWDAWLDGTLQAAAASQPDVSELSPLLRRRLDRLGRMALHTAWRCLEGVDETEFVFSSRHGSLPRTLGLLADIIHGEPPSPTVFSVSVHNGTAGLYSMARADRSATTAVAAGADSLVMGLLEAVCLVAAGRPRVLMCYADQDLPPPYATAPGCGTSRAPFSISLLLEPATSTLDACTLTPVTQAATGSPESALLRFVHARTARTVIGVNQCWQLARNSRAGPV